MYIDCDTRVGRSSGTRNVGGFDKSARDLLLEMDRFGIDKAIVFHTMALEYSPSVGNEMLMKEIRGLEDRLLPCWVVLPHQTGEMPHPKKLVPEMLENGVGFARIFPNFPANSHRFELAEWCIGELLSELEEASIPLLVDFSLFRREQPPFRDVYSMCSNHPKLPIILTGTQARNNRSLYPLLSLFDNLYIQTGGFYVHRGLEDVVERIDNRPLLFGSSWPVLGMGAAHFHLERSLISQDEKNRISGGTLIDLISRVETKEVEA